MAEFASKVDLIVEIVLERRLGHDWLDTKTVDRLARVLRADSVDLDLAAAPFVTVAECIDQRLEVGAVQHHRLLAFEVENRLTLLVRALSDHLHLDMADRRDDRLCLDGGGLDVARRKRVTSFHTYISILRLRFEFSACSCLCQAPPLVRVLIHARRSAWSARRSASPRAQSIARLTWTASRGAGRS